MTPRPGPRALLRINVSNGFASKARVPYVSIQVGDLKPLMISPTEARDLALNLLQCAESADQDAFLVNFAGTTFGTKTDPADFDERAAVVILKEYRTFRQTQRDDEAELARPKEDHR